MPLYRCDLASYQAAAERALRKNKKHSSSSKFLGMFQTEETAKLEKTTIESSLKR